MTRIKDPFIPTLSGNSSEGQVLNQSITYNQAAFTYNQPLYDYGGVYGAIDVVPIISFAGKSQASLQDQSLTYNNSGVVYNDIYTYGGIYGNSDVQPLFSLAKNIKPAIISIVDLYTPFPTPSTIQPVGPGWFLYITR